MAENPKSSTNQDPRPRTGQGDRTQPGAAPGKTSDPSRTSDPSKPKLPPELDPDGDHQRQHSPNRMAPGKDNGNDDLDLDLDDEDDRARTPSSGRDDQV